MLILKCKMCGGDLELIEGKSIAECQHCGTVQTLPSADNEKKIRLFNQANKLRMSCEFDRAASVYENIIGEYPEEAEAYWGLCLCNYGIEYVDDPATGEKKPTCHRASFEKLIDDENFNNALDYADMLAKRQYTLEAREIDRITEEILSISKNEKPYDIFICYKETDENNERTIDSLMAEKLYDMLTDKGYKVFFSRITLEDKIGMMYEPYIFAALNSAKIMLCIGTKYEHFHAVWVKNEWGRFLRLMAKDKSKFIFPCYKDCDPYIDLPQEFKALQAQDLGKVGAENDLIRGIEKILGKKQEEAPVQKQVVVNTATGATTETFLKRAKLSLEAGDFSSVNKFCESALNMDPENADAYLYKLLCDLKITSVDALSKGTKEFTDKVSYQRAYRFGDQKRKKWLEFCADSVIYNKANDIMITAQSSEDFGKAAEIFKRIPSFQDASSQIEKCLQFKELAEFEEEEARKLAEFEKEQARKEEIYQSALEKKNSAMDTGDLQTAIKKFEEISDYKDAKDQISDTAFTAIEWFYDGIVWNNNVIHIMKKVRRWAKLALLSFVIVLSLAISSAVNISRNSDLGATGNFMIACIMIAGLVILVISAFSCSYNDSRYNSQTKVVFEKGRISAALLGLLLFYATPIKMFGTKDTIKESKKAIGICENGINNLAPKTLKSFDAIAKKSNKEVRKIKNSHRRFNFRILLLIAFSAFAVFFASVLYPNSCVDKAMRLYEDGNYDEAYNTVCILQNDNAIAMTEKIICARQLSELKKVDIGDVIELGIVPDKASSGRNVEERDWLVLDIVGEKALIIENTYKVHSGNNSFGGSDWKSSEVRDYLNGEFIDSSFSEEQRDIIVLTDVYFDGNPDIETQTEDSTKDKVFLLSVSEARHYFSNEEDRRFLYFRDQAYAWMLRTPGEKQFFSGIIQRTGVDADGNISSTSMPNGAHIRAAMWIDISNLD